jgi:hypothetical protein
LGVALALAVKEASMRTITVLSGVLGVTTVCLGLSAIANNEDLLSRLPKTPTVSSAVPPNGDVNPYGIAFVPPGFPAGGILKPGDVVVANFNNKDNLQGTGTTIVKVNNGAAPSVFFHDAGAPGFSTALGVLSKGFVLVGQVPSTNKSGVCTEGSQGQEENVGRGSLLVINKNGQLAEILTSQALLDGPWDLTVEDFGTTAFVFVSDALSGSVTRLDLQVTGTGDGDTDDHVVVERETRLASGYVHRCDPAAFVVGPTGLALDANLDILYVASTGDNAIFAVPNAHGTGADEGRSRGSVIVKDNIHMHGPLGLVRTSSGHLVAAQGDAVNFDANHPSEITEYTAQGHFVREFSVDSAPGSAFGIALVESGNAFSFAAVDDGMNTVDLWSVP